MTESAVTPALHRAHQQALCTLLREFDRVCRELEIPYVLFAGTLLGAVRHQGFIPWDDDLDVILLREDYDRFLREAESLLDTDTFYLQKEFSPHWPVFFSKLRLNQTACLEKFHPRDPEIHQGIYMDIFPCDNARKSAPGIVLQFLASKVVIAKALDVRGYDTDSRIKKGFMAVCRLLPMEPFLRLAKSGDRDSGLVHSFFSAASKGTKNVFPRTLFEQRTEGIFEGASYPIPAGFSEMLETIYGDYLRLPPPEQRKCKQHAILVDPEHSYERYRHYRDGMTFEEYTRSIR